MSVSPIAPLAPDPGRPLWSVMIPTWKPDPAQLREALRSVLGQLISVDRASESGGVQVALVDDASPGFVGEAFLREVKAGSVTFHRNPRRLGIAGNWNRCLELARGHLVHLLHQDDFVRDGFYARVAAGLAAHPEAEAAFVQPAYVDMTGATLPRGAQVGDRPGMLDDWIEHVFVALKFACVGVVVRRRLYERLGGFDARLRYCLDWDMWQRIAVNAPIWYEPDRLACLRVNCVSATSRLQTSGRNLVEVAGSIVRGSGYLGPEIGPAVAARARTYYAEWALQEAGRLLGQRRLLAALVQTWGVRRFGARAVARAVLRRVAETRT